MIGDQLARLDALLAPRLGAGLARERQALMVTFLTAALAERARSREAGVASAAQPRTIRRTPRQCAHRSPRGLKPGAMHRPLSGHSPRRWRCSLLRSACRAATVLAPAPSGPHRPRPRRRPVAVAMPVEVAKASTACRSGLVALTFDDGPVRLGDGGAGARPCSSFNVPATFFMVGSRIRTRAADGAVRRRTRLHDRQPHLGPPDADRAVEHGGVLHELRSTRREMRAHGLKPSNLMRPPYGAINDQVRKVVAPSTWSRCCGRSTRATGPAGNPGRSRTAVLSAPAPARHEPGAAARRRHQLAELGQGRPDHHPGGPQEGLLLHQPRPRGGPAIPVPRCGRRCWRAPRTGRRRSGSASTWTGSRPVRSACGCTPPPGRRPRQGLQPVSMVVHFPRGVRPRGSRSRCSTTRRGAGRGRDASRSTSRSGLPPPSALAAPGGRLFSDGESGSPSQLSSRSRPRSISASLPAKESRTNSLPRRCRSRCPGRSPRRSRRAAAGTRRSESSVRCADVRVDVEGAVGGASRSMPEARAAPRAGSPGSRRSGHVRRRSSAYDAGGERRDRGVLGDHRRADREVAGEHVDRAAQVLGHQHPAEPPAGHREVLRERARRRRRCGEVCQATRSAACAAGP